MFGFLVCQNLQPFVSGMGNHGHIQVSLFRQNLPHIALISAAAWDVISTSPWLRLAAPGCFYEPVNVLTHLDLEGSQSEVVIQQNLLSE